MSEAFLWDSQPWEFPNSDNSDILKEKLPDFGPKTQILKGKEVAVPIPSDMPPPPPPSIGKKRARNGKGKENAEKEKEEKSGGCGGESDHDTHIWTERERRKKMRNMFSSLHALLPQLPPKADKSTIVDEAVNFIKTLQQTHQKLQKQKLERLHGISPVDHDQTLISPKNLTVDTREAFMADQVALNNSTIVPSKAIVPTIPRYNVPLSFQTFSSQNVVLNISADQAFINICAPSRKGLFVALNLVADKHNLDLVTSSVTADPNKTIIMMQLQTKIPLDQLPEGFPVEEVYKQAATEMNNMIISYCYQC